MADTNLEERQALEALPKSKLFRGLTFHFHGPITGYTSGKLSRLITKHGGKVSEKVIGRADVSHIILSGQLWGKQGTAGADPLVKLIMNANEENATESDSECNRTWLLEVSWVFGSLKKGKLLSERKFDWDLKLKQEKTVKQVKRKAELDREREANNGESVFGRGERVKWEAEQKLKRDEAEAARLAKMDVDPSAADGFSGLAFLKKGKEDNKGGANSSAMQVDSDDQDGKGKGKGKEKSLKHFGFGNGKEEKKKFSIYRQPLADTDSDSSDNLYEKPSTKKKASSSSSSTVEPKTSTSSKSKSKSQAIEINDTSDDSSIIFESTSKSKSRNNKKKAKSRTPSPTPTETEGSDSEDEPIVKKIERKKGTQSKSKKHEDSSPAEQDLSNEEEEEEKEETDSDSDLALAKVVKGKDVKGDKKTKKEDYSSKPGSKITVVTKTVTSKVMVDKDKNKKPTYSNSNSTVASSSKVKARPTTFRKNKEKKETSEQDESSDGGDTKMKPMKKKIQIVISDSE